MQKNQQNENKEGVFKTFLKALKKDYWKMKKWSEQHVINWIKNYKI